MEATLAVVVQGMVLGASGCAGQAPELPPETGFPSTSTTSSSESTSSTTGTAATTAGSESADGCTLDAQCSTETPACSTLSGECVECLPDGDYCSAEEYCDPTTLECMVGCDDDMDGETLCELPP